MPPGIGIGKYGTNGGGQLNSCLPEVVFTVTIKTGANLRPFQRIFQLATTISSISINFANIGSSTRDLSNVIGIAAHTALSMHLLLQNRALFGDPWIVNGILENGLKPDVVNHFTKTVWELKPISNAPDKSKANFRRSVTQISRYVQQINMFGIKNHRYVNGNFKAGGNLHEAPVWNGMPLLSADGRYKFIFSVPDPSSGIIYYEHFKVDLLPDLHPVFVTEKVPQQHKGRELVPAPSQSKNTGRTRFPFNLRVFLRVRLPLIIDGLGESLLQPLDDTKRWKEPG